MTFMPQAKHTHTHKNKKLKVFFFFTFYEHLVYSALKANLD
jgi:hypothetical protein